MHKHEAMLKAAVHKFRPILMTSIAALLCTLPLMLATGDFPEILRLEGNRLVRIEGKRLP